MLVIYSKPIRTENQEPRTTVPGTDVDFTIHIGMLYRQERSNVLVKLEVLIDMLNYVVILSQHKYTMFWLVTALVNYFTIYRSLIEYCATAAEPACYITGV